MSIALLIVNPGAGRSKPPYILSRVKEILSDDGYSLVVKITEKPGHATELARQYSADCPLIVVWGGDGTLSETINGVMQTASRPKIGYIPAGTTNDYATSMKIPRNPVRAAKTAIRNHTQRVDVGSFEDRFFTYVASFGAFTRVSYDTPQRQKRKLGHLAYVLEGIKSLADANEFKPRRIKLSANGRVLEDEFVFGSVTNSLSVGGLVKLDSDTVDLSDGLFEVMLIKSPTDFVGFCNLAYDVLQCKYITEDIIFFQTNSLTIETDEPLTWSLDGERVASDGKVSIGVIHDAVDILTPHRNLLGGKLL